MPKQPINDYRERIMPVMDGCELWTGTILSSGYGQVKIRGRRYLAHRWVYEQEVGPIPEELEIDHLCGQKACVRPSHLEVVTHAVNCQRRLVPERCPRGHEPAWARYPSGEGRRCKTCGLIAKRKERANG